MWKTGTCAAVLLGLLVVTPVAQQHSSEADRRHPFDEILDSYVRDGFVYYRALKLDRAKLDRYVASLATVDADKLSHDEQVAFWLNAYDAFVLKTVIDNYPIQRHSPQYPARSIRQIPGAFERIAHRAGGKSLTLDQIEQTVLAGYHDPRLYFAIGRGSVGGGRLRSEAYSADRLETQLAEVANECASRPECIQVDRDQGQVLLSAIFSWREKDFVAKYGDAGSKDFADRSPVERAALAFVEPKLLTTEREFLKKNQFKVEFKPYDWTLNDLTGRGGR